MGEATYRGWRQQDGKAVCSVERDGHERLLDPRLDLVNHSPTGFEWGYGGSGPAQLALALLADALRDDAKAVELHQDFKARIVAILRPDSWWMSEDRIRDWVGRFEAVAAKRAITGRRGEEG